MTTALDLERYLSMPNTNVATTYSVLVALLSIPLPTNHSPSLAVARGRLRSAAKALQQAWMAKQKDETAEKVQVRPADTRLDRAWAAVYEVLKGLSRLPHDASPRFATASKLAQLLFPDGRSFLTLPFVQEWAESDTRMKLLEEQQLDDDLSRVVGADVVRELHAAHQEYGKRVQGLLQAEQSRIDVRKPYDAARTEITRYAMTVLAETDPHDEASVELAERMLRPLAVLRERLEGSTTKEESPTPVPDLPPVTPETPVPEE